MGTIEINDLNDDNTVSEDDLNLVNGGSGLPLSAVKTSNAKAKREQWIEIQGWD